MLCSKVKVKVKVSRYMPSRHRSIALSIRDPCARRGWVPSATCWPLYSILQAGWVWKIMPPHQGFETRTAQLVARRYTVWAIPAASLLCSRVIFTVDLRVGLLQSSRTCNITHGAEDRRTQLFRVNTNSRDARLLAVGAFAPCGIISLFRYLGDTFCLLLQCGSLVQMDADIGRSMK